MPRPSARQRGYDHEWEVAARQFLRVNPVCTCGAPAVLVRHKVSIRQRPDLRMDRTNWLPGCRRCNALDMSRERGKRVVTIALDGWPVVQNDTR